LIFRGGGLQAVQPYRTENGPDGARRSVKLTLFHHIKFKDLHLVCKIQPEFIAESRSSLIATEVKKLSGGGIDYDKPACVVSFW